VPSELRRRVQGHTSNLCKYCRTLKGFTGREFTVDRIIPHAQGGASDFGNLCLCCF
jgi:hypothetical protein